MAEAARTYHGLWINWTYGAVRGSTLTLSSRDGGLLTAFLALFVAVAAGAIWGILAFIIHQIRAGRPEHDGLHHQQQAILRNTNSPGKAVWELVQLFFFWQRAVRKPLWRSARLALSASACLAVLGLTSVFSSQMVRAYGQETLIISDRCGLWSVQDPTALSSLRAFTLKLQQDSISAAAYSRACYGTDRDAFQCRQFFRKQIGFTGNTNGTCPFSIEICKSNTVIYEMDTGLVNSHTDLGVNTPESNRIGYRKKTSCALLERNAYLFQKNVTASPQGTIGRPGDTLDFWQYGTVSSGFNGTFMYNEHTILDQTGYALTSPEYSPTANYPWTPIDALRRNDADVSIIFMNANSITYDVPVNDPFFAANIYNRTRSIEDGKTYTYWLSNHFTNIMACTDQHQFCNPNNNQCTKLTHWNNSYDYIGLNPVQAHIAGILHLYIRYQSTSSILSGRGSSALRAQEAVHDLQSGPLPDDQWLVEVESWYTTGLAKLQRTVLEYAAGASNITYGTYVQPPMDSIQQALCYSQMVPAASDTLSFSIAGVVIVLLIGAVLIITNLILDTLVGLYQRKRNVGKTRRLQWILDGKLQLQRLAYEEAGMGEWSGGTSSVPITRIGDRIGLPKDVDLKHPRLRGRVEWNGSDELHESSTLMKKQAMNVQTRETGLALST